MSKNYYFVLRILNLKEKDKILSLLLQYRSFLEQTNFFKSVQTTIATSDDNIFIVFLQPKSEEDWNSFEIMERPQLRRWFYDILIEPKLVSMQFFYAV